MLVKGGRLLIMLVGLGMLIIGLKTNLAGATNYALQPIMAIVLMGMLAVLLVLGGLLLNRVFNQMSHKMLWLLIITVYLSIVGIQLLIIKNFTPSFVRDPFRVINTAISLSQHQLQWPIYFSRATNNVNITVILAQLLKITHFLPVSPILQVRLWQLALVQLVILVMLVNTYLITKKLSTVLMTLIWTLIIPFFYTYNLLVFYSDIWIMLGFGIVTLSALLLNNTKKPLIQGLVLLLAGSSALITQLIKPNFIVVIPALLIWLVMCQAKDQVPKKSGLLVVTISVAVICAFPVNKLIDQAVNFEPVERYEFPIQHWMMMGLNLKSGGTYSQADVQLTARQATLTAKKQQDTAIIKARLEKMSLKQISQLFVTKLTNLQNQGKLNHNYLDGYVKAPKWYLQRRLFVDNGITNLTRLGMVILYGLALYTIMMSLFFGRRNAHTLLAVLLILGLIVFHTLMWEANNRYGEAMLIPLLCIVTTGFEQASELTKKWSLKGWLAVTFLASCLMAFLGDQQSIATSQKLKQPLVKITGQYANCGGGFNYQPVSLAPKQRLVQSVTLPVSAKKLQILAYGHQNIRFNLYYHHKLIYQVANITSKQRHLNMNHDFNIYVYHTFKPGKYKLVFTNSQHTIGKVRVQKAAYKLQEGQIKELSGNASFIFAFSR
ncbi:hypothetical protein JOC59_000858 [Weissella beninensis]|uniref:Glycosyltransferase RgtA/B/C/D-like domain-containing protein n=1 Tax=Periweissella beninensis TaxID=504936 RepID=A0ABT0VK25_9LACO|nr:hypothetical protein [Periweissella beninensis]MBM7544143.1 hypothetical protein [Periweissella beninensis]MCM2437483.1 hypothetical protein [Periweissella beninensis]